MQYEVTKCKGGSDRYGACEVCGTDADTMYLQTAYRPYRHIGKDGTVYAGMAHAGCKFGHLACLASQREK